MTITRITRTFKQNYLYKFIFINYYILLLYIIIFLREALSYQWWWQASGHSHGRKPPRGWLPTTGAMARAQPCDTWYPHTSVTLHFAHYHLTTAPHNLWKPIFSSCCTVKRTVTYTTIFTFMFKEYQKFHFNPDVDILLFKTKRKIKIKLDCKGLSAAETVPP